VPAASEYHAATIDMIGAAPAPHPLDRTLPAAVTEWLDAPEVVGGRVLVAPDFYVYLDEGDDPPVYHEAEGLVAMSYSNFVFDLAASTRLSGRHLSATGPVPSAKSLQWLAGRLKPGPVTETEELTIHRFYGPHEYATVRWGRAGEAQWHLEADSEDALDALRQAVDRVGGVAPRGLARRLVPRKRARRA
jgi:hypothetical protein